jgi:hypothetical protein
MRRLTVLVAYAMVTFALHPVAASADEMPVSAVTPANGATLPVPTAPVVFNITSPVVHITSMYVEVATQAAPLGQDGTLANDFQKDFFPLFESDAYPGTYLGSSHFVGGGYWWSSAPGTYYWQAHASYIDYSTYPSNYRTYISPVYTLTIAAPATPAPTGGDDPGSAGGDDQPSYFSKSRAIRYAKDIIHDATGYNAYKFTSRCSRRAADRFRCRLSWGTTRTLRANTMLYAGTIVIEDIGGGGANYTFKGIRARASCLAHKSVNACSRNVRWSN